MGKTVFHLGRFQTSISTKIIVSVLFLSIISQITITGFRYFELVRERDAYLKDKLSGIADLTAITFSDPLWHYNQTGIDLAGDAFFEDREVYSIELRSEFDEVKYAYHRSEPYFAQHLIYKTKREVINSNDEYIGLVTIGLSAYYKDEEIRNALTAQFTSGFLILLLQGFVIYVLIKRIIKPIGLLIDKTKQIANGDFLHQIQLEQNDEIGMLAVAFNKMAIQLEHMMAERDMAELALEESNQELEEKVWERTEGLTKALKQLKEAQSRLIQSEKLSSMNVLITGVAHEINTPIGNCITGISFLKELFENFNGYEKEGKEVPIEWRDFLSESNEALLVVERSLKLSTKLIDGLKLMTIHTDSVEIKAIDLYQTLQEVNEDILMDTPQIHEFVVNCSTSLKWEGSIKAFKIIFRSLIENSIVHGCSNAQTLRIEIECQINESGELVIIYQDNGPGIDADTQQKMFDPFYTTSRGSGHVGLGLFAVFELAQIHFNGSIHYDPTFLDGARFVLVFKK